MSSSVQVRDRRHDAQHRRRPRRPSGRARSRRSRPDAGPPARSRRETRSCPDRRHRRRRCAARRRGYGDRHRPVLVAQQPGARGTLRSPGAPARAAAPAERTARAANSGAGRLHRARELGRAVQAARRATHAQPFAAPAPARHQPRRAAARARSRSLVRPPGRRAITSGAPHHSGPYRSCADAAQSSTDERCRPQRQSERRRRPGGRHRGSRGSIAATASTGPSATRGGSRRRSADRRGRRRELRGQRRAAARSGRRRRSAAWSCRSSPRGHSTANQTIGEPPARRSRCTSSASVRRTPTSACSAVNIA